MPKYTVTATRETYYEFEVEAADELDAEDQARQLEIEGDIEEYAIDWYPIEIESVEEHEEEEEEE
jgi:hypothetical protein